MRTDLYSCTSYRRYLCDLLASDAFGRGARAKLARALGCGNSFISQTVNGKNHLSLEQGQKAAVFLGLNDDEQSYFLNLIQAERAGTKALTDHFLKQLRLQREKNQLIQERIAVKDGLSVQDQMTYYSSWVYAAVHVLVSVPNLRTKAALAKHLGLPLRVVSEALEFLLSIGIVAKEGQQFSIGRARVHLGIESPILSKHHANWRLEALQALEKKNPDDLNFSSVMAMSRRDAEKIRAVLLNAIGQSEHVLKNAEEEGAYCLGIDFFKLGQVESQD